MGHEDVSVGEWLVQAVMEFNSGVSTMVRTCVGDTESFAVFYTDV